MFAYYRFLLCIFFCLVTLQSLSASTINQRKVCLNHRETTIKKLKLSKLHFLASMIFEVAKIHDKADPIITNLDTINKEITELDLTINSSTGNTEPLKTQLRKKKEKRNALEAEQTKLYQHILKKYRTNHRTITMFVNAQTVKLFFAYLAGYRMRILGKDSKEGQRIARQYKFSADGDPTPFSDLSKKERDAWYFPKSTRLKPFTQDINDKVDAAMAAFSPGGLTRSVFGWTSEVKAEQDAKQQRFEQEAIAASISGYKAGKKETPGAVKKYWDKTGGKVWGKVKSLFHRSTESENATAGAEPAQSSINKSKAAVG